MHHWVFACDEVVTLVSMRIVVFWHVSSNMRRRGTDLVVLPLPNDLQGDRRWTEVDQTPRTASQAVTIRNAMLEHKYRHRSYDNVLSPGYRIASRVSMDVTLLPRMTCAHDHEINGSGSSGIMGMRTTVPMGCFCAGVVSSVASSSTRLRKRSYPRRTPLTLRPPWRWTNNFLSIN